MANRLLTTRQAMISILYPPLEMLNAANVHATNADSLRNTAMKCTTRKSMDEADQLANEEMAIAREHIHSFMQYPMAYVKIIATMVVSIVAILKITIQVGIGG